MVPLKRRMTAPVINAVTPRRDDIANEGTIPRTINARNGEKRNPDCADTPHPPARRPEDRARLRAPSSRIVRIIRR